jgi:nicotinamidase-related amidase
MTEPLVAPGAPIIVIDLQTGMFDGVAFPAMPGGEALIERVRTVIDWGRRTGRKVAFVRHDAPAGEPLAPGAAGWPVWPALGQAPDEPTFSKSIGDAFSNPDLGAWVASQGAEEVVLLGAQTDQCVAATVAGAAAAGLRVTVVADGHGTWDWNGETARQIIERHNTAFAAAGARLATVGSLVGA